MASRTRYGDEEMGISFRPRQLDITKPLPVVRRDLEEEDPTAAALSNAYRAVPSMPTGMEREEETERHIMRALKVAPGAMTDQSAIPVPGVRIVDPVEAPGRPPQRYMPPAASYVRYVPLSDEALDATLEYDLTPSDSEWAAANKHLYGSGRGQPEDALELLIDRFEKAEARSYTELTPEAAAKLPLGGQRGTPQPSEAFIRAALAYYHQKRRKPPRRGEFLLDRLKPPPDPYDRNPFVAFRPRIEEERLLQKRRGATRQRGSRKGAAATAAQAEADPDSPAGIRLRLTLLRKDLAKAREIARLVMERELERARLIELTEQLLGTTPAAAATVAASAVATQQQQQQQQQQPQPMSLVVPPMLSLDRVRAHQRRLARAMLGHSDVAMTEGGEAADYCSDDGMSDDERIVLPMSDGEEVPPPGMVMKTTSVPLFEWVAHSRRTLRRMMAHEGTSTFVSSPALSPFFQQPVAAAATTAAVPQEKAIVVEATGGNLRLSGGPAFRGRARLGRGGRIVFDRCTPTSYPDFC